MLIIRATSQYNLRMAETLLTIQEAASISGKSVQTIRRALKNRKLKARRRKTPQGFSYMITQESLAGFYKLKHLPGREHQPLNQNGEVSKNPQQAGREVSHEFASLGDLKKMQQTIEDLLVENKKEKENLMRFMKAFQDRFVVLENQFKLLEQPKKHWYQFWR